MLLEVVALEAPGDRLREGPEARALAVEAEVPAQAVEATLKLVSLVAELERSDERSDAELALSASGFGSIASQGSRSARRTLSACKS